MFKCQLNFQREVCHAEYRRKMRFQPGMLLQHAPKSPDEIANCRGRALPLVI